MQDLIMSKHDSWVYLTAHSPLEDIVSAFPIGFPVLHPFPMLLRQTKRGSICPCWEFDLPRMSSQQIVYLASVFADMNDLEIEGMITNLKSEGAYLSYYWVESLECGPEGRARTAEIREFFAAHPDPLPSELLNFYQMQKEKWVEGNAQPEPEIFTSSLGGRLQWTPKTRQVNKL
jgi:hypothetical protein